MFHARTAEYCCSSNGVGVIALSASSGTVMTRELRFTSVKKPVASSSSLSWSLEMAFGFVTELACAQKTALIGSMSMGNRLIHQSL